MKSLESLLLSKNRLCNIPIELSECATITELVLSDNNFTEIPTKIMMMPNLKVLEAERKCNSFILRIPNTNTVSSLCWESVEFRTSTVTSFSDSFRISLNFRK